MSLYYAPIEITDEGMRKPVGEIPPSVRALKRDDAMGRFVLRTNADSAPIPAEWSQVDEALIEADYPGLLGGE
jgi:hypothetical protein